MLRELSDHVALGNMIWNAGWFILALALIRAWVVAITKKLDQYCSQNREDHKELHNRVTEHESRISRLEVRVEQ